MLGAPSQGWLIIKMQRKISFTTSTLLDKIECTQIRRGRVYVHMIMIMIIIQIIQIANYFFPIPCGPHCAYMKYNKLFLTFSKSK